MEGPAYTKFLDAEDGEASFGTNSIMEFPHGPRGGYLEWNVAREIRFLSRLEVALFFDST